MVQVGQFSTKGQRHDSAANGSDLKLALASALTAVDCALSTQEAELQAREVGFVTAVGESVAMVAGLPGVMADELVEFSPPEAEVGQQAPRGIAFNLDPDELGIILLDSGAELNVGDRAWGTGRVSDVPVGEALLGRVVDATGRPLDDLGPVATTARRPIERPAPPFIERAPVQVPLQTGWKVIDATVPIGRGQRELIVGDRQTGKTALAVETIVNQHDKDVICIYCAIGQRASAVAKTIAELRSRDAFGYCIVVAAMGDDPPGLQYITPYAATSIAEYYMERGRDVMVVYDDLTRHAWAYRELSLLLRRPPGREAYPGDIFYLHARLLERATHLSVDRGGGSLTALPIVETQAQDISAYIPTNLISITDGQVYLSPTLFQQGILPAVDVGKSVSRVGGKAQLPAYRAVASDLRLSYAQFQEVEALSRFGTQLDADTRRTLTRGWRVREILKQAEGQPIAAAEQVAILLALNAGLFDRLPIEAVARAERQLRAAIAAQCPEICQCLQAGHALSPEDRETLLVVARQAIAED